MAAILCNACTDICSNTCSACSHGCSGLCSGCGQACNGCFDLFGDICANMAQVCASPFSIFLGVAVIFNLPNIWVGLPELLDLQCGGSRWLFGNGLFCLINVGAAIYMAKKVATPESQPLDLENPSPRRPSTAFGRAGHLLCYDPLMAVYILVLLAYIGWLWTGAIWSLNGKAAEGCSESVQGRIVMGLTFGWGFIFCGCGALGIGMCCAYCGVGENSNNGAASIPNYGAAATTTTPYVNADTGLSDKKQEAQAPQPTVAAAAPATPAAASAPTSSTKQESIPTVQATLF